MIAPVIHLRPRRQVRELSIATLARTAIAVTRTRNLELMRRRAAEGLCSACAEPVDARTSVVADQARGVVWHGLCPKGAA